MFTIEKDGTPIEIPLGVKVLLGFCTLLILAIISVGALWLGGALAHL